MTYASGFGSTDKAFELQRAGELNELGEPKGLEVRLTTLADFVLYNVRSKNDPDDKGRAYSYEDARAYIVGLPDSR